MSIKGSKTPVSKDDLALCGSLSQTAPTEETISAMPFEATNYKLSRIALFSGNYNYVMDGPVRALNKLVAFLESEGIEVLVFAPTAKTPAFQHVGKLISVPSVALPGRGEYRLALGLPKYARKHLENFKPDIIHLAAPDLLGRAAIKWAKAHNVPAVSSFHTRFDTYPRYYHMAWLEKYITSYMRRFYHDCVHVYAPSDCMVKVLQEQNMAPDIRIWGRGVETTLFNPKKRSEKWRLNHGIKPDETAVLFVGRLVLEKGLGVFADTIDQLIASGIKCRALIVGEGPERERFQTRLPDAVFTGYLNGEDLATAYASADIFFNASITETFGNVTLEAMASGLPTVCADATGSRSLVKEGITGHLVNPTDTSAYAQKLSKLIQDKDLRTQFSEASLKEGQNYSWDAILQGLLANYLEAYFADKKQETDYFAHKATTDLHAAE